MVDFHQKISLAFQPRLLSAIASLAFVVVFMQAASPVEARILTSDEKKIVSSVTKYLNGFRNMEGYFVQIGPYGKYTSGRFFLSRPGRVRFEYEPPSPLMIVADGTWVSVENRKLKTSEHYPLSATPLKVILADKIDLLKDADITKVFQDEKYVTLTLKDKGSTEQGELTLVFEATQMVIKEWIVVDGQGFQTRIAVSDMVTGIKQDPNLFFIKKPDIIREIEN